LLFVEHITSIEVGFAGGDALLGLRIGEQLQGRLDGLEILCGEQHDVVAAVASPTVSAATIPCWSEQVLAASGRHAFLLPRHGNGCWP
jgi:hypothetical protein